MSPKVLLLGFDYADDIAALALGAADLCQGLCQKFAIGLESLSFNTDLDEQLNEFEKKIHQIKTLAQQTFHLSWEQLIQEESNTSKVLSTKAVKPLISRAKLLHLQQSILKILSENPTTPFFGLNNDSDVTNLLDCFSSNHIKWAVLFLKKDTLIEMKKSFNSSKIPVEAFFLFSSHYPPAEEIQKELKQAHIISMNVAKFCLKSSITSFIQEVCKALDEKGRLSISMTALGKKHAPKSKYAPPLAIDWEALDSSESSAKISSPSSSLGSKMKNTLKEFRSIFNNGDSNNLPNNTIIGNRHSHDDDE